MQHCYGDANLKAGLTAVGLALLGIAASKILIVYFLFKGTIDVSQLMSVQVLKVAMEPMDLLFVGLAALTAYRLGPYNVSFNEQWPSRPTQSNQRACLQIA